MISLLNWLLATCLLVLAGCAAPESVYRLKFDTRFDNQNTVVVDYRLTSGARVLVAADVKNYPGPLSNSGYTAFMPPPTTLYVKWRDLGDGSIHENTVDLRGRLPRRLDGNTLYFTATGSQLRLFLIWDGVGRPADQRPIGPYPDLQTVQLYPAGE
jgi:hypothetical protein